MADVNAGTVAEDALRLGLLADRQVQEAWHEVGRTGPAAEFLRFMERKTYLTPFQSGKLLKGDRDGFLIGGYRLLYKIASGSFGRVYRADDPATKRIVAVKVLRNKWSKDQHKIDLFLREGNMGMSLRHPNIVEILAVNQDKKTNQYYIVMEFVEGGNLRDFLDIRKKLPTADVLRIVEETAAALAYAVSRGITHRDMKLTNILLSSQGPVKLVDFGLAGAQFGASDDKDDMSVDRTVDYAGLEKATNAPHCDPRSDLFFLGCVAYELLTGRSPLQYMRSAHDRMAATRFQKIAPLNPDEVRAPPSVFRLMESLLALDYNQRIQTAGQLLERVRECRGEVGGKTPGPGGAGKKKAQATIFLVESDEKLQDVLRAKLKEKGFRMLIAADPVRALDRFRQQPFDLLIVDADTTGENGYHVFERIMDDVRRQNIPCCGILMLNAEQTAWQERMKDHPGVATLTPPIKYKQLLHTIRALLNQPGSS